MITAISSSKPKFRRIATIIWTLQTCVMILYYISKKVHSYLSQEHTVSPWFGEGLAVLEEHREIVKVKSIQQPNRTGILIEVQILVSSKEINHIHDSFLFRRMRTVSVESNRLKTFCLDVEEARSSLPLLPTLDDVEKNYYLASASFLRLGSHKTPHWLHSQKNLLLEIREKLELIWTKQRLAKIEDTRTWRWNKIPYNTNLKTNQHQHRHLYHKTAQFCKHVHNHKKHENKMVHRKIKNDPRSPSRVHTFFINSLLFRGAILNWLRK